MLKKVGFIFLMVVLVILIRPHLFFEKAPTKYSVDVSNNSSLETTNRGDNNSTNYAEGYDASDFGEAFESSNEGKFEVVEAAPPVGPWADLLQLKFSINFDKEADDVVFKPKFTSKIKSYENKYIEVEGFIIPYEIAANALGDMSDDGQQFMFSAFPLASCFFCGEAGAESVMEVSPKNPISYTKEKIKIRGKLELNEADYLKLPYLLKEVEIIE
jgi:hypothetical protein